MPFDIHLHKYLDFHSEGASLERYLLKKHTTIPFTPTVGLEVLLPGGFGFTCSRVVWISAQNDFVVWDTPEQINADQYLQNYPTIAAGLQVYLDEGWETAEKIPEPHDG